MTGRLPRRLARAVLRAVARVRRRSRRRRPAAREWSDPWEAQRRAQCDGCARLRQDVVVLTNRVVLCAACHEAHLELWRRQDEEDELREGLMDDAWHRCGPGLEDAFNPPDDR